MTNLYDGVQDVKAVTRYTKIEQFFSKNRYTSKDTAVHISELNRDLLTDDKMKEAFEVLLYGNGMIKNINNDYFYLNEKAPFRAKKVVMLTTIIVAAIIIMSVICTILLL